MRETSETTTAQESPADESAWQRMSRETRPLIWLRDASATLIASGLLTWAAVEADFFDAPVDVGDHLLMGILSIAASALLFGIWIPLRLFATTKTQRDEARGELAQYKADPISQAIGRLQARNVAAEHSAADLFFRIRPSLLVGIPKIDFANECRRVFEDEASIFEWIDPLEPLLCEDLIRVEERQVGQICSISEVGRKLWERLDALEICKSRRSQPVPRYRGLDLLILRHGLFELAETWARESGQNKAAADSAAMEFQTTAIDALNDEAFQRLNSCYSEMVSPPHGSISQTLSRVREGLRALSVNDLR